MLVSEIEYKRGTRVGRSIHSFCKGAVSIVVEFDGSLTGLGWRIFELSPNGHEKFREAGQVVLDDFDVDFNDVEYRSSYQNACETCAFTMALCHCSALGYQDIDIRLRGDSTTALAWGSNDMFKSRFALAAVLLQVALCEIFDYRIGDSTEWIASKENDYCDTLSRGSIPPGVTTGECGSGNVVLVKPDGFLSHCMTNCNPVLCSSLLSTDNFIVQW